jgi:hypothetical protein
MGYRQSSTFAAVLRSYYTKEAKRDEEGQTIFLASFGRVDILRARHHQLLLRLLFRDYPTAAEPQRNATVPLTFGCGNRSSPNQTDFTRNIPIVAGSYRRRLHPASGSWCFNWRSGIDSRQRHPAARAGNNHTVRYCRSCGSI